MKRVLKGEGVFNRPYNRSCQVLNQGGYPVPVRRLACTRKSKVRLASAERICPLKSSVMGTGRDQDGVRDPGWWDLIHQVASASIPGCLSLEWIHSPISYFCRHGPWLLAAYISTSSAPIKRNWSLIFFLILNLNNNDDYADDDDKKEQICQSTGPLGVKYSDGLI